MTINDADELRAVVREHYGKAATEAGTGCCGGSGGACCGDPGPTSAAFGQTLYQIGDREVLPEAALVASLGCGNPTALAELRPGEVVLDLGSGGGIDVLLSARRVAPTGKAYGLDMTPEMHQLAQRNQAEAGVTNAEFLLGTIENIPLPDASVDVHHLQLRGEPGRGQGHRLPRGFPRPSPRWPPGHLRHRSASAGFAANRGADGALDGLHRRCLARSRVP